jgi:hypothetical protein
MSALTTDFNGREGSLAFWVRSLSSDGNSSPNDWNLFTVKATTSDAAQWQIDVRVPDAGEAKPDALTIDYIKVGVSTNTIQDTNFISSNWQMIGVVWTYADTDHELRYYKNGVLISTSTDIPAWTVGAPTSFELQIGPANHGLSHMALWNTPLATSDMLYIYERGSAGDAVTMDIDRGAFGSVVRLINPTAFRCYLTSLTIKGKRIKRYRDAYAEAVGANSRALYGQSHLDWDMPYETDPEFARLFAAWLLGKTQNPASQIESLSFVAGASSAIFKQALALEPGDRVLVQEGQTGLSAAFHVAGMECQLANKDSLLVTLYVVAAESTAAWNAGIAGFSEAGETTYAAL